MSLAFPPEGADTNTLVAFCKANDSNGNWPQHWTTLPAPWLESNTPRPSSEHVWYDWEGDCWMTDADLHAGLLETIARWKAESGDLVPPPGLPVTALAHQPALTHEAALRAVRIWLTQPVQFSGTEDRSAIVIIRSDCALCVRIIDRALGVQS